MQRTVAETKIGERHVRYRTRIEDLAGPVNTQEARIALYRLLATINESPDLINCGYATPQKISIYHSGTSWVLEAEATVDEG